jgi:rifampicin phosphotransferase
MTDYVLNLRDLDQEMLSAVGGKCVNLGELSRLEGIRVPDGFCVIAEAYRETIPDNVRLNDLLARLSLLKDGDRESIVDMSAQIRGVIEQVQIPMTIEEQVMRTLSGYNEDDSFAIRSSATMEDLPRASFAGQHDTYLNIRDKADVLLHIVKCWASLFSERAITYRLQNNFDLQKVSMAVIVQKMVASEASGTIFTADPTTSDRKTISIEAGFGLGEAFVSGLVDPDVYKLQNGEIINKSVSCKQFKIVPSSKGGTISKEIEADKQLNQTLTDPQINELAALGRKIGNHFVSPQDIEWCFAHDQFYILQSRPITTLFPIPETDNPNKPRVYMSVGHLQMMTDPIKPLGISFFEPLAKFPLNCSGGRVFADITHDLSSFIGRIRLLIAAGKQDPLVQGGLKKLLEDKKFVASLSRGKRNLRGGAFSITALLEAYKISRKNDPALIDKILDQFETELQNVEKELDTLSGEHLLSYLEADLKKMLKMAYDNRMIGAIVVALLAENSLNNNLKKWLDIDNAADTLSKSVDHNITTAMGLALCDLADTVRQHHAVIELFEEYHEDKDFYAELEALPGGLEVVKEINKFLERYGMRCPGEIDLSRKRWVEKPTLLLPMLMNNVRLLKPGEHLERFNKGRQEAIQLKNKIISRLKQMPGGKARARKVKKQVSLLRNFCGCREYPKYYIVRRLQLYRKALLREAAVLVQQNALREQEDLFYFFYDEVVKVIKKGQVDYSLIEKRKTDYKCYEKLNPPRLITSEGLVPVAESSAPDMPDRALPGIPASGGTVEGRARVITEVSTALLEKDNILVTRFTDPSWTPLFATAKGVVTEVDGFTTHGAIIAREYGIPAVLGVVDATGKIKDGQKIRINGTVGFVELL